MEMKGTYMLHYILIEINNRNILLYRYVLLLNKIYLIIQLFYITLCYLSNNRFEQ